jgi:hypothetical protein
MSATARTTGTTTASGTCCSTRRRYHSAAADAAGARSASRRALGRMARRPGELACEQLCSPRPLGERKCILVKRRYGAAGPSVGLWAGARPTALAI